MRLSGGGGPATPFVAPAPTQDLRKTKRPYLNKYKAPETLSVHPNDLLATHRVSQGAKSIDILGLNRKNTRYPYIGSAILEQNIELRTRNKGARGEGGKKWVHGLSKSTKEI